ncbi:hypothetical protein BGX31_009368 [Mortierella sp. GBA43]|nr:hypothetical protein BGX31_009368 [Mortierella sp. GBA43]
MTLWKWLDSKIAQQNTCKIRFLSSDNVFTIEGEDPKMQRQALDALGELLERKSPEYIKLAPGPIRDVTPDAKPRDEAPPSGLLIDLLDMNDTLASIVIEPTALQTPKATRGRMEFHVRQEVRDPFHMYYPEKSQKASLPVMLAEACGCEAHISDDGRIVEISGDRMDNIRKCILKLEQMQGYYLRTPFRKSRVALVFTNYRQEFRLFFVPVIEHLHFSKSIEYLPSSVSNKLPRNFCVLEIGIYDDARNNWVLKNGVKISRDSNMMRNSPTNNNSRGRGAPQHARGRGSSAYDQPSRPPAHRNSHSASGNMGWHEQENPSFGFGAPRHSNYERIASQPPGASGWGPNAGKPQSSSQPSWQAPGTSSSRMGPPSGSPQPQATVRRLQENEWSTSGFESSDGDFPSLSSPSKGAPKKGGMPPLPAVRKPGSGFDTAESFRGPDSATSRQAESSSRSGSFVIGESEFDYLESIPTQPSASSRQWERDRDEQDRPRLRDGGKEKEAEKRVIQTLPRQQASPSQPDSGRGSQQSTFLAGLRRFNMKRLTENIWNGLRELQGKRKEIRLIGRFGTALYPLDSIFRDKAWEYAELENLIARETKLQPVFSPVATTKVAGINRLRKTLGVPKSETAHFEIMCGSRTNPQLNFVPTIIRVPSAQAILDRVVTPWETYGDVIWDGVDKHLDFQILLQAREGVIPDTKSALGRTDVKPFSTFRKKLSIGTHNSHITCYNIKEKGKDYLEIHEIVLRESKTYELPDQFTLVIHQVKELEVIRNEGLESVRAEADGHARVWFEVEIYSEKANQKLQANQTLMAGTVADWEVKDILGDDTEHSWELLGLVQELMGRVDELVATSEN